LPCPGKGGCQKETEGGDVSGCPNFLRGLEVYLLEEEDINVVDVHPHGQLMEARRNNG
jgi:hypothetical protein